MFRAPHPLSCRFALLALAWALPTAADPLPGRAVMNPLPGVEIGYESLAPSAETAGPGRLDGALALPTGTLRTAVHVEPGGERRLRWGDTSLELPAPGWPGQLQLRGLEAGGAAATWRGPLGGGTTAETQADRTPVRTGHGLVLRQDLGGGDAARARLDLSSTEAADGARWEVEWSGDAGPARWTVGLDGAARDYVSAAGGAEPRAGLRLGTRWRIAADWQMEVNYAHQRWEGDTASSLRLGTQLALPGSASLATGVEVDAQARPRAQLTLKVPVRLR